MYPNYINMELNSVDRVVIAYEMKFSSVSTYANDEKNLTIFLSYFSGWKIRIVKMVQNLKSGIKSQILVFGYVER